ncbi:MAG: hypothetical protein GX596_09795, partial [Propionibacterium sp.]|nr:hypothetical protein [Propionibacterium sp.]
TAEGGAIQIWDLVDGLEARDTFSGRYPAAPFDAIDSEAIQREVEALTHECEDNYRITVNVVTPSAHVTELRCGETSFLELVATAPVRVHLGGTPLPDYAGASVEETWQHVLAQVALLDPDMAVSRIDVDDEQVGIWLAEHSATNDCLPSMSIARDGSEAGWACWSSARGPAIPLGGTTAAELAQLQRDVMTEAGIVGTDGLEATIDVANGVPALAVRQGPLGAEAPLR